MFYRLDPVGLDRVDLRAFVLFFEDGVLIVVSDGFA